MFRVAYITVSLASAAVCAAAEIPFNALYKAPSRFSSQTVTVRGLIEVAGDYIYIWPDAAACKRQDYKKSIFVVQDLRKDPYPGTNLSPYSPANLRWAKVSGTVDVSYHGLFGDLPFGLRLGKIDVLPGPRLKELLPVLVYLRNETGRDVELLLKAGGLSQGWTIPRGEVDESAIPRDGWSAVASFARHPFLSSSIRRLSGAYYDRERRAYYYRITLRSFEPVLPHDARSWKFAPSPERD